MILKLKGTVSVDRFCACCQEPCYADNECGIEDITVGGKSVFGEINKVFPRMPRPHVYVALADSTFDGDLYTSAAMGGYSEWTPGDPLDITVGKHDVVKRLEKLEDQEVTLWIADEPVNTLE